MVSIIPPGPIFSSSSSFIDLSHHQTWGETEPALWSLQYNSVLGEELPRIGIIIYEDGHVMKLHDPLHMLSLVLVGLPVIADGSHDERLRRELHTHMLLEPFGGDHSHKFVAAGKERDGVSSCLNSL